MLANCQLLPKPADDQKTRDTRLEPLSGTSTVVRVNEHVVGTLVRPDAQAPHPVVLMLHGFGSTRDEVGDMFVHTAHALAKQGIASLRIDFRGGGDSAGVFRETTIDGQRADAEHALTWLKNHEAIDPDRIGVVGFSLGAAIAILTAGQYTLDIHSMVLWSPMGDLHADFLASLGADTFERAEREGSASKDLGFRKVTLDSDFFRSLNRHDIGESLTNYKGPFLVIAGRDDPLSRHARTLSERIDGMTVFVEDADHIFNALDPKETRADTVVQATVVQFTGTLKWQ